MSKLRALIWCAVSTSAQAEDDKDSLPNQEREALALCQREGWEVVDILRVPGHTRRYIDIHELASAMAKKNINAFERLLQLWRNKAFDVLVCWDGNRFARTQSLHAYVVERTFEIGAQIYVITKGWITEREKRMFISMDGYAAASEADSLVAKRHMGQKVVGQ